jgi:hypothetical protein
MMDQIAAVLESALELRETDTPPESRLNIHDRPSSPVVREEG